jgi:hypothetical protein
MANSTVAPVTHKRAGRLWVIALVAALHAGVLWGLLRTKPPLVIRNSTTQLEVTYITLDTPKSVTTGSTSRPRLSIPPVIEPRPPTQPNATAATQEDNAINTPIDWADELDRTVKKAASDASAPQPRVFGAPPLAPEPQARPPELAWSRSSTHRLETYPGGTAVHLGDNCVIAFTPLPFPVCRPGKKAANGDLFKHMRDPTQSDDSNRQP